ncbi:MAG: type 4a pilus biogenesis protein PilO [Pseudomonadales bacterium]|nr:type 4a pilus biogenesis protein PilO [Pseudomonadales bacterium]
MAFSDQLESLQEQIQNFDPNELSADNIGSWPMFVKVIAWVVVFSGIIFGGYKFIVSDMQDTYEQAQAKESSLKQSFANKAKLAVNLEAYRKQMVEMEESFGALISQLPSDTEVPGLLEDITNKGSSSGLIFDKIDLQPEKAREFYIELPIQISATGAFHDMGAFVSGVASLPRIVTLTNFTVKPAGRKAGRSSLELNITANTYRYKDEPKKKKTRRKKK